MEFVVNNYLWFLIGGIVLLMIIIGYFAEKTNFGKIPLNSKKKQLDTKEEDVVTVSTEPKEEIKLDKIGIADALAPEENLNVSEKVEEPIVENNVLEEDLNVPFGDANIGEPEETPSIVEPKEDLSISSVIPGVEEVSEIPEVIDNNSITDESEDDVWKF